MVNWLYTQHGSGAKLFTESWLRCGRIHCTEVNWLYIQRGSGANQITESWLNCGRIHCTG